MWTPFKLKRSAPTRSVPTMLAYQCTGCTVPFIWIDFHCGRNCDWIFFRKWATSSLLTTATGGELVLFWVSRHVDNTARFSTTLEDCSNADFLLRRCAKKNTCRTETRRVPKFSHRQKDVCIRGCVTCSLNVTLTEAALSIQCRDSPAPERQTSRGESVV